MRDALYLMCLYVWTTSFIGWLVALRESNKCDKPIPISYSIVMIIGSIGMIIALHI